MDDTTARQLAERIEKDAFEQTNQEAGQRPEVKGSELVMSYARRCGDLMLAALRPPAAESKEEAREARGATAVPAEEKVVSSGRRRGKDGLLFRAQ